MWQWTDYCVSQVPEGKRLLRVGWLISHYYEQIPCCQTKRAERLQSKKCQPRATRPQAPFQGPPHGLVFCPDYGVNGTTNPQTQQTQHAHIMRVHLAGCYKGQAQQTRDQSRSCPKSLSRRVSKRRPNHCAQRDPPCRFQRRLAGAFSAPIHSATTTADTGTPRRIDHAVRDFNLSCF